MDTRKALEILTNHQKWRRYNGPITKGPSMCKPSEIGEALDVAIKVLKEKIKNEKVQQEPEGDGPLQNPQDAVP